MKDEGWISVGISEHKGAVVALMPVCYGMQESITGQLSEMADIIMVMPGRLDFERISLYGTWQL